MGLQRIFTSRATGKASGNKTLVKFRLPNSKQRIAIVGRTGTGKTVAAGWHLSTKPLERQRWVVINFKGDEFIDNIPHAIHMDNLDFPPKQPGVYIYHPTPDQLLEVNDLLWKIWEAGNIGVWVDEGYMVNGCKAFDAILTQGRSKHIPVIVLSQRPVWMSRFVFSEADFYQVFSLNDKRDQKTLEQFTPIVFASRLPDYHSYYYDVGRNSLLRFAPVPNEDEIYKTFERKLQSTRAKHI